MSFSLKIEKVKDMFSPKMRQSPGQFSSEMGERQGGKTSIAAIPNGCECPNEIFRPWKKL